MKKKLGLGIVITAITLSAGWSVYAMAQISFSVRAFSLESNGQQQVITVSLAEPLISASGTALATLSFDSPDPRISVSPHQLRFTGDHWWAPQLVTVTKLGNAISGGNNTITVPVTTVSNSEFYNGFSDALEVTLTGTADPKGGTPNGSSSGRRIPQTTHWWNANQDKPGASDVFTKDLVLGMQDRQVRLLQQFLNHHDVLVALTGKGSPGNETEFFGPKTVTALKQYQHRQGLKETGVLDAATRLVINQVITFSN